MKVALFTSNHPRHISLINRISHIADELHVIQETKPMFLASNSCEQKYLEKYMDLMSTAELQVFGDHKFHEGKNFQLSVGLGEASKLNFSVFEEIMDCDFFIVFGCGILSGDLGKFLIKRKAINLHMGISPFFKGAACNFWAQYFGKSEFVGATIHYLS